MKNLKIGVLGIQGAVSEHVEAINNTIKENGLEGCGVVVKTKNQLEEVQALIIPGGESTTIGRVSKERNLFEKIVQKAKEGLPIIGT